MFNPVTDRLKLVEEVVVSGRPILGKMSLSLFNQVVSVKEGVSQEIFRGQAYLGCIRPASFYNEKANSPDTAPLIKVQRGDIIYNVTLVPQPNNFAGTVQTLDKYQRIYDIQIELVVTSPTRFIEWYHQSKDPAGWVIDSFKRNFENWAMGISHDKLDSSRPTLDSTIQLLSHQCGIKITRYKCNFRPDPVRSKALEIHQNTELRKIEIESEHVVKALEARLKRERDRAQTDFEREEKLKHNNFQREERIRNQQNAAYLQLLSETVKDLVEINRGQMRDAFEYDGAIKAVLQNSIRLLKVFDGPIPETGKIIDGTSSDRTTPLEDVEDVNGLDINIDPLRVPGALIDDDAGPSSNP